MIGPELPSHLLQPKSRSSSPTEVEPEAGPSAGPSVGPQIPAHLLETVSASSKPEEEEDEEEDDYAPALPPDLLVARSSGTTAPKSISQGPSLPSGAFGSRYDEDSDDDDYGPRPLPSGFQVEEKSGVALFLEQEARRKKLVEVGVNLRSFSMLPLCILSCALSSGNLTHMFGRKHQSRRP